MAIVTKAGSPIKGAPTEFTLNKSELASLASVSANTHYSNQTNWKETTIYYRSSVGNQIEILKFNAELASPVATFLVSEKARDIFQVQKIVIMDFDGGSIVVPRSELTTADFDIDMTPAPSNALYFENITSGITRNGNSLIFPLSGTDRSVDTNSLGSGSINFDITFNVSNINGVLNFENPLKIAMSSSISDPFPPYGHWYIKLQKGTEFYTIIYLDPSGNQNIMSNGIIPISVNNFAFRMVQSSGNLSFYNGTELLGTYGAPVLDNYYATVESNNVGFTISASKAADLIYTRDFSQPHENPPPVEGVYSTQGWYEFGGTISGGGLILNSVDPEDNPFLFWAALLPNPDDNNYLYTAFKYRLYLATGSVGNTISLKSGPEIEVRTITSQEVQQGFIEKIMSAGDPNLNFTQQNRIGSYDESENPNDGGLVIISKIELRKPYS